MRNLKIVIQYEGTRYQGWQRQETTENTIQGKLEAILARMTGLHAVQVDASGRTDAGVHALGQVANFKIDTDMTCGQVMDYINQYLPEDIGVLSVREMPERFHSRLHAKGKRYQYRIWNSKLPCVFERRYVHVVPDRLDVGAMEEASSYFVGRHDFQAFTSGKKGRKSTVRTIDDVRIQRDGDEIKIMYSGDGFLYHMARIMTGTLIEVGRGERSADSVRELLENGKREQAGALAPAKGLCLMEVYY